MVMPVARAFKVLDLGWSVQSGPANDAYVFPAPAMDKYNSRLSQAFSGAYLTTLFVSGKKDHIESFTSIHLDI